MGEDASNSSVIAVPSEASTMHSWKNTFARCMNAINVAYAEKSSNGPPTALLTNDITIPNPIEENNLKQTEQCTHKYLHITHQ